MKKKKQEQGFTTQRAVEQIMKREDNVYSKDVVRSIIKMYLEECQKQLIDGNRVEFEGICSFKPHIVTPRSYGLPRAWDSEVKPFIKMQFDTKRRLLDILKAKLNKNLKKGIKSLKEDNECLDE